MSRAVAKRPTPSTRKAAPTGLLSSYLDQSRTPLTALLFVIPLLILHELGVQKYGAISATGTEHRITAFALLARLMQAFGASGRYLPALVVVAVLLAIHIAHRDRWVLNIPLLPLMVVESVLWAAPLVGVYYLFSPGGLSFAPGGEWKLLASLYLGAGVYEELVFRLGAFALLSFLLMDVGRVTQRTATPFIVLAAAALFSAYHMWGTSELPWQAFVFIGLRGVYYGTIFLERGFGITVGVHTAYDLLFVAAREASVR
jgi:hypothetical protein